MSIENIDLTLIFAASYHAPHLAGMTILGSAPPLLEASCLPAANEIR
jgi:hypothetical protein